MATRTIYTEPGDEIRIIADDKSTNYEPVLEPQPKPEQEPEPVEEPDQNGADVQYSNDLNVLMGSLGSGQRQQGLRMTYFANKRYVEHGIVVMRGDNIQIVQHTGTEEDGDLYATIKFSHESGDGVRLIRAYGITKEGHIFNGDYQHRINITNSRTGGFHKEATLVDF